MYETPELNYLLLLQTPTIPVVQAPVDGQAQGQGTPSSLSPTPSPSGSVGSVGSNSSQSSGYSSGNANGNPSGSSHGNGSGQTSSSGPGPAGTANPPCVSVPMSIYSMISKQHKCWTNLKTSHELWDRADDLVFRGNHTGKHFCAIFLSLL